MATIYMRMDEVYRTRIEDVEKDDQFFYPVYQQAERCLTTFINYTDQYWREQNPYEQDRLPNRSKETGAPRPSASRFNPMRLRGYPNNIIAFCADRGYGKTSAMLSFSKALKNLGRQQGKLSKFWDENFEGCRFFPMEPIDPTVLENKDQIIPTIISRMFTEFADHARILRTEQNSDREQYTYHKTFSNQELRDRQQKLLQLFQDCYRLADDQKDGSKRNDSYDDLQLLADRGDSSNFKVRFFDLVWEYLKFMCLEPHGHSTANSQRSFLVIQIDDADMNPAYAYDVVEDLRKYCVLPNVIILFATNLEQLEMCVEQHFLKSFEILRKSAVNKDHESENTVLETRRHCHHTAVSYTDKLIPSLHRIILPNINDTLQNYGTPVFLHHDNFHEDTDTPVEYQDALIQLLNERCMLALEKEPRKLHPFLPRRMRELTHFLNRLISMNTVELPQRKLLEWAVGAPGCEDLSPAAYTLKGNLEKMLEYLVSDWSDLALDSWQRTVIREIHRASTDRKITAALDAIRQSGHSELKSPCNTWKILTDCIAEFESKGARAFVCALELYFQLYKNLLTVNDCIRKYLEREGYGNA